MTAHTHTHTHTLWLNIESLNVGVGIRLYHNWTTVIYMFLWTGKATSETPKKDPQGVEQV